MEIRPIAYFHSPFNTKFGIPRQSGLATELEGRIVFTPPYRHAEAIRGLEDFSHLWLIWEFSGNPTTKPQTEGPEAQPPSLTVRPPRLGGNERVGVFASRSPFRPNNLGLSCVALQRIELTTNEGPVVYVTGADLMDGTPIYDIKPYVAYADSHPEARCGFVDSNDWETLTVDIPDELTTELTSSQLAALRQILALDPRPQYHNQPERIYGMPFCGCDVRFTVSEGVCRVVEIKKL
jgi:tRNA-Thr(GGU) m(6)t(6)A37 methyltransferase TsaA